MFAWLAYLSLQSLAFTAYISRRHRQSEVETILLFGVNRHKPIPVLDRKLAPRVGQLTKFQDWKARKSVSLIRKFVNTAAFEHLVRAKFNPKSDLHVAVMKMNKAAEKVGIGV